MKAIHALSVALPLVLLAASARAAKYEVGPTKTYKQLTDVAPKLLAGDLVLVDGGATYNAVLFNQPGLLGVPIIVRGVNVGGKKPVISGGTNSVELQGDHYVFENFEVTGGSSRCIYHHADDITIRFATVHDCPTHGILGADNDSGSLLLEFSEVYKCGGGTQHHQIYIATDEVKHPGSVFMMQHCYVHDANGGNSVKSRAERNQIYYNWIEGAQYHELELIGPDPSGGTPEALKREDSDVVGNVLRKTGLGASFYVTRIGGDGTGQTNGRYRFVNNTFVMNAGGSAAFRIFDGIESVEMHNNVFFTVGGGSLDLKREVEAVWVGGSSVIAGSDNWVPTGAANVPSTWTGTVSGADPMLVAVSTFDLHPASGSPLIDKGNMKTASAAGHEFPSPLALPAYVPPAHAVGTTALPRPVVSVIDIGAYEFGVGPPADAGVVDTGPGPTPDGGPDATSSDTGGALDATSGSPSSSDSASPPSDTSIGSGDAAIDDGSTSADPGSSSAGGCGCRVARADDHVPLAWVSALGAALAVFARRARRRRPIGARRR